MAKQENISRTITHVKTSAVGETKCFHFGDFYTPRSPQLPSLCLWVFSSSPLEQKKKKKERKKERNSTPEGSLRTITFSGEIHSEQKHSFIVHLPLFNFVYQIFVRKNVTESYKKILHEIDAFTYFAWLQNWL